MDIQTDGDYTKRVVHGPSGATRLKRTEIYRRNTSDIKMSGDALFVTNTTSRNAKGMLMNLEAQKMTWLSFDAQLRILD